MGCFLVDKSYWAVHLHLAIQKQNSIHDALLTAFNNKNYDITSFHSTSWPNLLQT